MNLSATDLMPVISALAPSAGKAWSPLATLQLGFATIGNFKYKGTNTG
jgi:hypothetical protein